MNRYQICAHNKKNIGTAAPPHIHRYKKEMACALTDRQVKYYQDLIKFCKEKNIDISFLKRPRTRYEVSGYINAVKSILRRNNLDQEFLNQNKEVTNNGANSDEHSEISEEE